MCCFLLKHNIGDCIVHLDGFVRKVYWQEEQPGEEPGEDQSHPSAYNRRLQATQSPNN